MSMVLPGTRAPERPASGDAPPVVVDGRDRPGRGHGRVRRAATGLVRLLALVAGAVALYVMVTFFQVVQASTQDLARPSQAIVVLGAAQYDGRPSPALAARLDHAYDLWRDGVAPVVVVTGGRQPGDRFTEATASANYLLARGVPDEAILREVDGSSTWESMAATSHFLHDRGITSIVAVTDAYHALRVGEIARGVGLDAAVSPVPNHAGPLGFLRSSLRETAAVSVGRVVGFDRLLRWTAGLTG